MQTVADAADPIPAGSLDAQYRAHVPGALRLAVLLTGDRALSEDLVHDAFVRVAAKAGTLRDEDAFAGYLKRSVVNAVRSHFRHEKVVRKHEHHFRPSDHALPPDIPLRDALWDALQTLPERQRVAVVLRYYEGASERQIAETMDCAAGTVKSYLSRGLARLREVIGDE